MVFSTVPAFFHAPDLPKELGGPLSAVGPPTTCRPAGSQGAEAPNRKAERFPQEEASRLFHNSVSRPSARAESPGAADYSSTAPDMPEVTSLA